MGAGASQDGKGGDDPNAVQAGGTQRDGAAQQHSGAAAKVTAVNAFQTAGAKKREEPPSGGNNSSSKTQDELDEEEWEREKQRLSDRLREKREREAREREAAASGNGAAAGSPDGAAADATDSPTKSGAKDSQIGSKGGVAPPASDQPKRKKLLNGTNIEYRYPSGSVYLGGFKDGKLHGFGKYNYHPSGDLYEGEWIADMKHGQGAYTYDCGDKYQGEWRTGKKHGKGTYSFTSGDEYIGSWKDDKIHGHGVFTIARNGNRYEGAWQESYRHGFGVLKCGNGDVYEGNWAKGKEDGAGVLTYVNGNRYAGDWKAGQMDGKGILFEDNQKFTVEHIAGYLIAKVPVEAEAAVDPDWNPANKLYLAHLEKEKQKEEAGAAGGAATGGGGGDNEAYTKLKIECDMWEKKYKDLLASKAAPNDDDDDADARLASVEKLRERLKTVKEQRDMAGRRADEAEQREKQSNARIEELEFELKRAGENTGTAAAGGDAPSDVAMQKEMDKMQRRLADAERELAARKAAAEGTGRSPDDPMEMKARLELMEGEVRMLRSTREELQKVRQQNLELNQTIMGLESRNEELIKEVNMTKQRASHATTEGNSELDAQLRLQKEEIQELRTEIQDLKVATLTAENAAKKAKKRLKEAEEKALRVDDLEAQVAHLKLSSSNQNSVSDKRRDEVDALKAKNAELARKLEEVTGEAPSSARLAQAAAMAANASSGNTAELQSKLDAALADYKKEKKKHKKASAERDELQGKLLAAQAQLAAVERRADSAEGKVICIGRLRGLLPAEEERGEVSGVAIEGAKVTVNGRGYDLDACLNPNAPIDQLVDELRPTVRAAAAGFNTCVMTLGAMNSGKTHTITQAVAPMLQELFKACDEAGRPGGSAAGCAPTIHTTCVEVACDGIFDLNNGGSTGADMRAMKDAFGAVVLDGVQRVPISTHRDAVVDFNGAIGRRRRQRSHVIYTVHVAMRHKVKDSVLHGRFTIADLCGTGSLGDQSDIESAKFVNSSMMALSRVVGALATPGQQGVPYRDDPLTQVLSDALGGNCRLATVAAIGPGKDDAEATAQVLDMAAKLTSVSGRPLRMFESSDVQRLRGLVAQLQSPAAAEPALVEIDSLRE